jgi:hypothetical protein
LKGIISIVIIRGRKYKNIYELATKQKNKMLVNLNKIGTTGKATPGPGSLAAYSWRGVAWLGCAGGIFYYCSLIYL